MRGAILVVAVAVLPSAAPIVHSQECVGVERWDVKVVARDLARCLTHYWRREILAALTAVNFPDELGGRSLSRILLLPGNRQVFDAGLL